MTMRYAEYAPDPRLARLVRCYWVFEAAPGNGAGAAVADDTIVPDGNPELVFHYGESFSEIAADARGEARAIRQPRSLFAGQLTRPLTLRANGARGVVSVRFEPWGARAFWDMPMSETTDAQVGLDDMPGHWLDGVTDRIREAKSDRARIAALERALLARLAATGARADPVAIACVRAMRDSMAPATLRQTAERIGLSARQLERRFDAAVGMPPRLLASVLRFRAVFDALTAEQPSPGLRAAIDAGYFDQAHMIRDFKRFAGKPPQAFYRSLAGLSAALVQPPP